MSLLLLRLQRWHRARRHLEAPYRELIDRPFPDAKTAFSDLDIVSLDIETTGLDPATADILSVGWVLIRGGKVDLGTAVSRVVRPASGVGDSAAVHGLTDTVVEAGSEPLAVLPEVIEALTGRVLLVHYAGLDKAILDRLCQQHYGGPLLIPLIDTLALEHRRRRRRHHADEQSSLRLADLRGGYGLPRYAAHDSLIDAIATAELLIAMVAHNDGAHRTTLKDLCG